MTRLTALLTCLLFTGASLHLQAEDSPTQPIPIIFDTDFGNDCDDALALGVIHALQSRGECELIAVTLTKDHELAAAGVDAINTFYGRGDIPIGVCDSGVTSAEGKFNAFANSKTDGKLNYPHDLLSGKSAPDAISVLRKALAGQADGSVVIAQVGFSTNLANLLDSPADKYSKLSGLELVKKKVRLLSVMAGAFPLPDNPLAHLKGHGEYNIVKDIPAAQKLAKEWPTPIVWSGYEIGVALPYPHESIEQDYGYVTHHPLADAYRRFQPPPHNRPTWDLTSVLHAIRPDRGYFKTSEPGTVTIADDARTTFKPSANGRDTFLILDPKQTPATLEALVQLSSQPPSTPAPTSAE